MFGVLYDENLQENPFFIEITTNHTELVQKASEENWVICIPRADVIEPFEITNDVILDHIFFRSSARDEIWYSLSKKQVSICDKEIRTFERPCNTVRILFEETYYMKSLKYTVFCIENPLFLKRKICVHHKVTVIETLDDCIDWLWSENLSPALVKIQSLCEDFLQRNPRLALEDLQTQKDLIGTLFSQCLQLVLKNRKLNENCDNLKLAVETYMQSCLDKSLIRALNTVTCFNNSNLNKIIRNYSDLQLKDFNIPIKFCDIITQAKSELCKINNYVTILDKVNCLKLTFKHLCHSNTCPTSDDILQILVLLILKSNIPNWSSNLIYLTHFQFSSLDVSNENHFFITSLEAALEFIKANEFHKIKSSQECSNPIFQTILTNDLALLQKSFNEIHQDTIKLCHPLCNCDDCQEDSSHNLPLTNEKGQSLLIFATIVGHLEMVEFLLNQHLDINFYDYFGKTALHYACLKGHQDLLLILMNSKADVNVKDIDGNSPLHCACNNGHETCVKALLYTSNVLNIDSVNKHGDTPLHLATKWNFIGIVEILLETGAVPSVANKKRQLPIHLSQNYYLKRLLYQYYNDVDEILDVNLDKPISRQSLCKDHGVKAKGVKQLKKIDLLLKAIENNDFPLTCFYLGFPNESSGYSFQTKCHPLCNCEKCDDDDNVVTTNPERLNVNICNIDGFTPLHFAAKFGRSEILRVLLDSQASPNLKTYKTLQTPLHLACVNQKVSVVKMLVECRNCYLDAVDYKGNTALYYACLKNSTKIVEVLLGNGASCDSRNYQGTSVKEVQNSIFI